MIVRQFSTAVEGGAAIAARRHHESLLDTGIDSRFLHRDPPADATELDDSYALASFKESRRSLRTWAQTKIRQRQFQRAMNDRPPGLVYFSSPDVPPGTRLDAQVLDANVLHLHWVAGMLDYPSFFSSIPDDFPVVWTMHDMNPFTGGCHYSRGCEAFRNECQGCPQLGRQDNSITRGFFDRKMEAVQGKNLHIVTPSYWLNREVRSSRILGNARSIQTIAYGLPTDVFKPHNKQDARRQLGLSEEGVLIGFGAVYLAERRKGVAELLQALPQLKTKEHVSCLTFGIGEVGDSRGLPPITSMGYLHDPQRQALVYSAADIFVMPSLEEAFGLTGLEALACGTPVVGFDTGGVPDFVQPHNTGLLARVGDAPDLARQIDWLIDNPKERLRMGANGRTLVENEFEYHKQAAKYVALYESILPAQPSGIVQPSIAQPSSSSRAA